MDTAALIALVRAAAGKRVVCVGDVMLDRFVYGHVARISPEAPVPIMRRTREAAMPGGAGNVGRNLSTLGMRTSLIGVVGDDAEGRALAELLGQIDGVESDLIVMRDRPSMPRIQRRSTCRRKLIWSCLWKTRRRMPA